MDTPAPATLCPAQQRALDDLLRAADVWNVLTVSGGGGSGRTAVLRAAHARLGGVTLGAAHLMDAMTATGVHPLSLEERFYAAVGDALRDHPVVLVDDLHVLVAVTAGGGCGAYPRTGLLNAPLLALCSRAIESGRKLVFGTAGGTPIPVNERSYQATIGDFTEADYESLCHTFWAGNPAAAAVDYKKIHRFAPRLNAHQLKGACAFVTPADRMDTDRFIDFLRAQRMASNVDLQEVQAVDLSDLKGVDDVLRALEAGVIVPLEHDELAAELQLKPKRGVLLAGPPGTGKTTIGRALAHRLKGKFFLIDGTFISGTAQFYHMVASVFEAAKNNAPSVIFIDDSDVIFENGQEAGLYRYLLTMLDGLESQSAGRVCVMMTAMNVASLPPALVRSGRIELWLETRLPDEAGRREILRTASSKLPASVGTIDVDKLAAATDGFTGADLKRLLDDGKIQYAYDRAQSRPTRPATDYFLEAVAQVRQNKERYAEAEARAREQRSQPRPPWFDVGSFVVSSQFTPDNPF